jgi:hypothetical protein
MEHPPYPLHKGDSVICFSMSKSPATGVSFSIAEAKLGTKKAGEE